jgi:hypothetical protein
MLKTHGANLKREYHYLAVELCWWQNEKKYWQPGLLNWLSL